MGDRLGVKPWLLLGASVAALALAAPATAQTQTPAPPPATESQGDLKAEQDDTAVGEVVVTARRQAERLRDIPVAATVIGADFLSARGGVADVGTALSTVPGLRYFNTSTPTNSEIALRSSGTSRGSAAEAGVGLYRNNAYIAGGGNQGGRNYATIDLFDVSRIEVLRGTQAALYGRNAVGGAINVISAQPGKAFEAFGMVRYGVENERFEAEAVFNTPIDDHWSARFGVRYVDQTDGFFLNIPNNVYHDQETGYVARAQLRYEGEKLKINWLAENQIETVPALFYTFNIPPGTPGYPLGLVGDKYATTWSTAPLAKQNVQTLNMQVDWDIGWGTLTSTTNFRRRKSLQVYDNDATNVTELAVQQARGNAITITDAGSANENNNLAHIYYQDLHVAKAKTDRWSALLGGEFLQISADQRNIAARTPTRTNTSTGNLTTTYTDIKSGGVYGSVGYDVTKRFNLGFEGRYTSDTRYLAAARVDRVTNLASGATLISNVTTEPDNFSYNVLASYHPDNNWLIYGKYGTGFRAGGFNTGVGDPRQPNPIPPSYGDETSNTGEVGAKGNIFRNLYVTVAGYRSEIDDFLVQQDNGCAATNPVCPVNATAFLINGGKAETWGVELEASARFSVFGGPLRIDASLARTGGEVVDGIYKGRDIPQSTDWNGAVALNYSRTIRGDLSGFGNFNLAFRTGGVQEIEQTPDLHDNVIADIRVGLTWRKLEASIGATNLFDEEYVIFETSTVRRFNQPRVISLQLRYRY